MGILALIGAGAAGTISAGDVEMDASVQAGAGIALSFASVVALISGTWSLLCGILGLRAANDNQKIMIVWFFTLIALALQIINVIMAIFGGSFGQNWLSYLFSLAWPGLMFWIANNIKQEAGK